MEKILPEQNKGGKIIFKEMYKHGLEYSVSKHKCLLNDLWFLLKEPRRNKYLLNNILFARACARFSNSM